MSVPLRIRKVAAAAAKALAGGLLFIYLVEAIDRTMWSGSALLVGAVWYALASLILIWHALFPETMRSAMASSIAESDDPLLDVVLALPLAHLFGFVLLVHGIHNLWGAQAFVNAPSAPTLNHWIGYGLDTFLSIVLLGAWEIFGLRLTSTAHHQTFLMSALVFSYHAIVSIALIGYVVAAYKLAHAEKR